MPIPKKGHAKECWNYHTVALISHAGKVMLKILKARLQQYVKWELAMYRKLWSSALLTMSKPLTVWITINCGKLFKRWEYQTTCLLRNMYEGQEATVRTGHGTTDWFQTEKGARQDCILSPCLFNLHAELLLLLLSCFSRVWLCVTPYTAAHQTSPSLGFSRQEHWSGLPFPSPMHESEKWKWNLSVMSDS